MAKEKEYPASNLEFLTAHYVNEARSLVCVKWWNHEDETQYQEFTAPRIGEPIFDRLLTHIDLEDLMDLTYKFREESKLAFESVAVDIAKKEGLIWDINDADATHMMKAFAEPYESFIKLYGGLMRAWGKLDENAAKNTVER